MNYLNLLKNIKGPALDVLIMTERNILRYMRVPQLIIFSTIQPVMFLLLFTYVFGGAIKQVNGDYINYLLPGIFVQTVLFGAIQTGIGLTEDLGKGLINRFKSLPITRGAVLAGRTISDTLRNIFVLFLMVGVGYLIGFKIQNNLDNALAAFGIILLFGFAFSWISATIGLVVKNSETAQVAGFIWIFPLVFASSIFVPIETMPNGLATFAKYNPISIIVDTVRYLINGGELISHFWLAPVWIIAIFIIFVPLSIQLYRKIV
jgi:ABC transporter DrrB family efflux protein